MADLVSQNDFAEPLVSVVIPTYNREDKVIVAIESVQRQSYSNWEIIVVDDFSTDDTVSRVKALNNPAIKILQHKENLYAGAARNTGMNAATGQYIAFLDSDDTWHPTKLQQQIKVLEENPETGFCFAGVVMKKGRGYKEKILLPKLQPNPDRHTLLRFMTGKIHIITTTFVFRRELLERVGLMDTNLRRNQDMDFFIRMIEVAKATSIEKPVADFFPNYSPPSLELVEKSNTYLLSKHTALFDSLGRYNSSKIRSYYRFMHGQRHIERGQLWTGLRLLIEGVCINPFLPPRAFAVVVIKMIKRLIGSSPRKTA